jgi:hypothetical protein
MPPPSIPKMEVVRFSETLLTTYQSIRCHNAQDYSLNLRRWENIKAYINKWIFKLSDSEFSFLLLLQSDPSSRRHELTLQWKYCVSGLLGFIISLLLNRVGDPHGRCTPNPPQAAYLWTTVNQKYNSIFIPEVAFNIKLTSSSTKN